MKKPEFHRDGIRAILENPFYAGLIARYPRPEFDMEDDIEHPENIPTPTTTGRNREILELHPGKHEPLVSVADWQAVNALRKQKASTPVSSQNRKRIYPLSGVARCWECFAATGQEYTLRGTSSGKEFVYYRCAYLYDISTRRSPKKQHQQPGIDMIPIEPDKTLAKRHTCLHADKLETQVGELVSRLSIPEDWMETIMAYYITDDGMSEFERESYNLRQSLKRHKDLHLAGHLSLAEYEQQARFIARRLDALKPSARPAAREIRPWLESFSNLWSVFTNGEKRSLLSALFAALYFDRDGNLRHARAYEPFGEMLGLS